MADLRGNDGHDSAPGPQLCKGAALNQRDGAYKKEGSKLTLATMRSEPRSPDRRVSFEGSEGAVYATERARVEVMGF